VETGGRYDESGGESEDRRRLGAAGGERVARRRADPGVRRLSAIDWDREFEEPWRGLGKAFLDDLAAINAGEPIIPLSYDRRLIRLSKMSRSEIAVAAGVSERYLTLFASGQVPEQSPQADRVRAVLSGELLR
jgi:hypothetical protein